MRTKRFILTWFLCISLLLSTAVMGHAFSSILAFGDSLSDNGTYGMYTDAAAGLYQSIRWFWFSAFF